MQKALLITSLSLALLASCTKVEIDVPAPIPIEEGYAVSKSNEHEISFEVRNSAQTKAENTSEFTGTFKTYGFYTGDTPWEAENSLENAVAYIPGVEISKQGNTWKAANGNKYLWPRIGNLSFVSYAPASAQLDLGASKNSILSADNFTPDVDLLIANTAANNSASENGNAAVPTVFSHVLSQVSFGAAVKTLSSNGLRFEIVLNSISLEGISSKGNLIWDAMSNKAHWSSVNNEGKTIYVGHQFDSENSNPVNISADTYFIPQNFSTEDKLSVTYTLYTYNENNNVLLDTTELQDSVRLNSLFNGKWEAGKSYKYNLTINPLSGQAISFDAAVVAWETVSTSISTINE